MKSLPTSLYKGRNYPSLAKRGEGRFSGIRVNSILRALINKLQPLNPPLKKGAIGDFALARFGGILPTPL
jgi:hypothetical protein